MRELGQRIMIIGSGGSGKSVLAARLGRALDLPAFYLDAERGELDQAAWLLRMQQLADGDRWIMDGNMGIANMDGRMARATSIIFLDYTRRLCLWRGLRRNIAQQFTRRHREDGCPARPDWTFIRFVWRFPNVQRPQILAKLMVYPDKAIILKNPGETEEVLFCPFQ